MPATIRKGCILSGWKLDKVAASVFDSSDLGELQESVFWGDGDAEVYETIETEIKFVSQDRILVLNVRCQTRRPDRIYLNTVQCGS